MKTKLRIAFENSVKLKSLQEEILSSLKTREDTIELKMVLLGKSLFFFIFSAEIFVLDGHSGAKN